jgi:hypothetical protein
MWRYYKALPDDIVERDALKEEKKRIEKAIVEAKENGMTGSTVKSLQKELAGL